MQPAKKKYNLYFIFLLLFYTIWVYYLCFIKLTKWRFLYTQRRVYDTRLQVYLHGMACLHDASSGQLARCCFFIIFLLVYSLYTLSFFSIFLQHSNISFFEVFDQQVYDYLTRKPDYLVYGRVFQFVMVIILTTIIISKIQKKTNLFQNNETWPYLIFCINIKLPNTIKYYSHGTARFYCHIISSIF